MTISAGTTLKTLLQRRIEEIREQRQSLSAKIKELDAQEAAFMRALEAETRFPSLPITPAERGRLHAEVLEYVGNELLRTNVKDVVLEILSDGKEWSLKALKRQAEEKNLRVPEGQALGRVIHGALMGLLSGKKVEHVRTGIWRIKQDTPPTATPNAGRIFVVTTPWVGSERWWPRPELNRHVLRGRPIPDRLCLPIPPRGQPGVRGFRPTGR